MGQLFHVEVLLVPTAGTSADVADLARLRDRVMRLDERISDVLIMPVAELPSRE